MGKKSRRNNNNKTKKEHGSTTRLSNSRIKGLHSICPEEWERRFKDSGFTQDQKEWLRKYMVDSINADDFPSTPLGQLAQEIYANKCDGSTSFQERLERHAVSLTVDDALCDEISKLPLTENIYMVDVDRMASEWETKIMCHCGLVTKECGSNGKHWNPSSIGSAESKADGLSLTVAVSVSIHNQRATHGTAVDFSRKIILETIAKACKNPGAITGTESMMYYPIKPSRPRKIILVSEGMMMSTSEIIKRMGIPELCVADKMLAGSMRSSFSTRADSSQHNYNNWSLHNDAMYRAMESGNSDAMARAYGSQLCGNDDSYYVSEQRHPLYQWKPEPPLDVIIPEEWWVRPGDKFSRFRMLCGWRTNMDLACERNDSKKIKDLCQRYPLDDVKEFVESRILLTMAAKSGSTKACRALLKYAHAAVDGVRSATNQQKWVPIQDEAGNNGKAEGITPLYAAIASGHTSVVQLLVQQHGANIELSPYSTVNTPLHLAVDRGHPTIVECLLFAGADVDATNERGNTPMDINQKLLEWGEHGTKQFEKIAKMFDTVDTKIRRCVVCNADSPKMHCPCRMESYCGLECQRKNWKSHKQEHKEAMEVWKV